MKLLISGGHPSPAMAVIDTLQQSAAEIEIVFIGRVVAQHGTGQLAGEEQEITRRKIPFFAIQSAKWGRSPWQKISAVVPVIRSVMSAYRLLGQLRPDVFLSFGSYVAVPIAIACKLRRIPIVTHEQTRVAGISNRVIAAWADVVAISYPESAQFFPKHKIVLTGLPLRPQLFTAATQTPTWAHGEFRTDERPILYVTGGSTGSHAINDWVISLLPELLKTWRVVHPCGKAHDHHDWLAELLAVKNRLPKSLQDRYVVLEQLSVAELAWLYRQTVLVIGRAGANTTAEVAAFGLPAVFVPLPMSNFDEQRKNAMALTSEGNAVIIEQNELAATNLQPVLDHFYHQLSAQSTVPVSPPSSIACQTLIDVVLKTAQ